MSEALAAYSKCKWLTEHATTLITQLTKQPKVPKALRGIKQEEKQARMTKEIEAGVTAATSTMPNGSTVTIVEGIDWSRTIEVSTTMPIRGSIFHNMFGCGREASLYAAMTTKKFVADCNAYGLDPTLRYIIGWGDDTATTTSNLARWMYNFILRDLGSRLCAKLAKKQFPVMVLDTKSNRDLLAAHHSPMTDRIKVAIGDGSSTVVFKVGSGVVMPAETPDAATCTVCSKVARNDEGDSEEASESQDGTPTPPPPPMWNRGHCGCLGPHITWLPQAEIDEGLAEFNEMIASGGHDKVPTSTTRGTGAQSENVADASTADPATRFDGKFGKVTFGGYHGVGDKANLVDVGMGLDSLSNAPRSTANMVIAGSAIPDLGVPAGYTKYCTGTCKEKPDLDDVLVKPFKRTPVYFDRPTYSKAVPGSPAATVMRKKSMNVLDQNGLPTDMVWDDNHHDGTCVSKCTFDNVIIEFQNASAVNELRLWYTSQRISAKVRQMFTDATRMEIAMKFHSQIKANERFVGAGLQGPDYFAHCLSQDQRVVLVGVMANELKMMRVQECNQNETAAAFYGVDILSYRWQSMNSAISTSGLPGDMVPARNLPTAADYTNIDANKWNLKHLSGYTLADFGTLTKEQRMAGRNELVGDHKTCIPPGNAGMNPGEELHKTAINAFNKNKKLMTGTTFRNASTATRHSSRTSYTLETQQTLMDAQQSHPRSKDSARTSRLEKKDMAEGAVTCESFTKGMEKLDFIADRESFPPPQDAITWQDGLDQLTQLEMAKALAVDAVLAREKASKAGKKRRDVVTSSASFGCDPIAFEDVTKKGLGATRRLTAAANQTDWHQTNEGMFQPGSHLQLTGGSTDVKSALSDSKLTLRMEGAGPMATISIRLLDIGGYILEQINTPADVMHLKIVLPTTFRPSAAKGRLKKIPFIFEGKEYNLPVLRSDLIDSLSGDAVILTAGGTITASARIALANDADGKRSTTATPAKRKGGGAAASTATQLQKITFVSYKSPTIDMVEEDQDVGIGADDADAVDGDSDEEDVDTSELNVVDSNSTNAAGGGGGAAASASTEVTEPIVELPVVTKAVADFQKFTIHGTLASGSFSVRISGSPGNTLLHENIFANDSTLSVDHHHNNIAALVVVVPAGASNLISSILAIYPDLKDKEIKDPPSYREIRSTLDEEQAARLELAQMQAAKRSKAAKAKGKAASAANAASSAAGGGAAAAAVGEDEEAEIWVSALKAGRRPPMDIVRKRMRYLNWKTYGLVMYDVAMFWFFCASCGRRCFLCPFKDKRDKHRQTQQNIEDDACWYTCCLPDDFEALTATPEMLRTACRNAFIHEYCLDTRGFFGFEDREWPEDLSCSCSDPP